MTIPADYLERVYAGVCGKLIGVYLGRPFEGWAHERIVAELGEVRYYVNDQLGQPLIVTDDDLAGTFTFVRALEDAEGEAISSARIGESWLNYIVPGRTVLWWGGVGNSTEHTAYLNLRDGIAAPESGSATRNGQVVAEQIGAQIFIDGWAMLAPGDPERAADLARRAAAVSHDGEAIYGAQALAAMEALAFAERRVEQLLAAALRVVPANSTIARLYHDMQEWCAGDGDWRRTRSRIAEQYGYDHFGGNCHIVPNHALILLGLLYAADDFQQALPIVCTSGWDTDCNAGNLGCLLGIRGGLGTFAGGPDWRGPLADRLYLPTADGGRCITDAASEALRLANMGRRLAGEPPLAPKGGARFHFSLPGSVQGFQPLADDGGDRPDGVNRQWREEREAEQERFGRLAVAHDGGMLRLRADGLEAGVAVQALTPTFIPPGTPPMAGYELLASPTLYPGQSLRARVVADAANAGLVHWALCLQHYGPDDEPLIVAGPEQVVAPGECGEVSWTVPELPGPICGVGVEVRANGPATLYLDWLTWDGAPTLRLSRPAGRGVIWRRAWVDALDGWGEQWPEPFRIVQNRGRGMLIHGTREWADYAVEADVTPHLVARAGIAARVQGLRRSYDLLLRRGGGLELLRRLDGVEQRLAAVDYPWQLGETHTLRLEVRSETLRAWVAPGRGAIDVAAPPLLSASDGALAGGAIALIVEQGRTATWEVRVAPA